MKLRETLGKFVPMAPGAFMFHDASGAPAQLLEVVDDDGQLCARFEDDGDVELVPVADMAGKFSPAPKSS